MVIKYIPIIPLADLNEGDCHEFTVVSVSPAVNGFLVKHRGQILGYENRCPHTGAPLNWQPHQFLNSSLTVIQCAIHGAQFKIEDGVCIHGPCLGDSLQSLPIMIEDSRIFIALSA